MQRYGRLLTMHRAIPVLAALVGLVALAGAVLVQVSATARDADIARELARLRAEVATLAQQVESAAPAPGDALIEAMLALQQRLARLEAERQARPDPLAPAIESVAPAGPTYDCIPAQTRFMATVGDAVAICETPISVRISAVTDDSVLIDGIGVIAETASQPVPSSNCTLSVLSADGEGFAELRVSCP